MAKKKKKVTEEPVVVAEEKAKPFIPNAKEIKPKAVEKESDTDIFIREQLKVINSMSDTAKARRLAARVLRNKRKG